MESKEPPKGIQPVYNIVYSLETKSERKADYERHIDFLKWALGIAGTIIAVITAYVLFLTNDSLSEFKKEHQENLKKIEEQHRAIVNSLSDEAKELKVSMRGDLNEIRQESYNALNQTKEQIYGQIPIIKEQTENLALTAVRRTINEEFEDRNIRSLIEVTADEKLRGQAGEILEQKIKNATADFDEQTEIVSRLSVAADQIRFGNRYWLDYVDSISKNHRLASIRRHAKFLYTQKVADYENSLPDHYRLETSPLATPRIIDTARKADLHYLISYMVNLITSGNDLRDISVAFLTLRRLSKKDFVMFDFEGVKNWYEEQYPSERQRLDALFKNRKYLIDFDQYYPVRFGDLER